MKIGIPFHICLSLVLISICMLSTQIKLKAQQSKTKKISFSCLSADTLIMNEDSAIYFNLLNQRKRKIKELIDSTNNPGEVIQRPTLQAGVQSSGLDGFERRGAFIDEGHISYLGNYRSIVDTPYAGRNILQHQIMGDTRLRIYGLPINFSYLLRRSNSDIFRNIQDFHLSLDQVGVRQSAQTGVRDELNALARKFDDSLNGELLDLYKQDLSVTKEWLYGPFQMQRLIEANEVLKVPGISDKLNLSKEQNQSLEDSLQIRAARFLNLYHRVDSIYKSLHIKLDSLTLVHEQYRTKAKQIRSLSNGSLDPFNYSDLRDRLAGLGVEDNELPGKYNALMNIRSFSLGRSPLNYSELTAKNLSVNGINVEYNSWYYAAFAAGLVDFRFREFAVTRQRPQYLILGRLGLGRIENNFIILSAYSGKKQLYAATSSNTQLTSANVKGLSLEAKWKLNRNSYLLGEVGQSVSPDFSNVEAKTRFNLSDRASQAVSGKLSSYYPKTRTRFEATFKNTGANFQSFSSFQTNATTKSWSVKADQTLWSNQLKLSAGFKNNDLSNSYAVSNYSSKTVYANLSASLRLRRLPSLSVSYMPLSQLSMVDGALTENRFQALNVNVYHYYSIREVNNSTTVMYNRFFNNNRDTAFVYSNAKSMFFSQNIFIGSAIAGLSVTDTRSNNLISQVFDESFQVSLARGTSVMAGIKINNYNKSEVKVGTYGSASMKVWKSDMLYLSYERGFLPGLHEGLVRSDMITVQFTKRFGTIKIL